MTNTVYGLLGRKLGHSFSKAYFTEKFRAEGIEAIFENFELADIADFAQLRAEQPQIKGLSVTIPYKVAIIPYLDVLSQNAQGVGAVNSIVFRDGLAIGHNTDVVGFRDSLAEVYPFAPGGKALILGTGGAAKAVEYALIHFFEFEEINFVSRQPGPAGHLTYEALKTTDLGAYRLVVNTTPLGMHPDVETMPDIDLARLGKDCFVFDLVYNPDETKLLQAAKLHGLPCRNGLDMLMRQADASWEIWNVD